MAEANETVETVKTAVSSDGTVKIAVEKYNELLETIADQRGRIGSANETINRLRAEPPVVHQRIVQKTAEMAAQDNRVWGGTLMGLGASSFIIGAFRYKAGRIK